MPDLELYEYESTELSDPINSAVSVTPSDVTDLTKVSRALYIGSAGNISVEMFGDGSSIVFSNVPAGTLIPIRVKRVNATGTSASSILSLY